MSGQSWIDEFYSPLETLSKINNQEMIKHALKKWNGLTEENLSKHNVHVNSQCLLDENNNVVLKITKDSCSLCAAYFASDCVDCPIYNYINSKCFENSDSPYSVFLLQKNPNPMIEVLKQLEI